MEDGGPVLAAAVHKDSFESISQTPDAATANIKKLKRILAEKDEQPWTARQACFLHSGVVTPQRSCPQNTP